MRQELVHRYSKLSLASNDDGLRDTSRRNKLQLSSLLYKGGFRGCCRVRFGQLQHWKSPRASNNDALHERTSWQCRGCQLEVVAFVGQKSPNSEPSLRISKEDSEPSFFPPFARGNAVNTTVTQTQNCREPIEVALCSQKRNSDFIRVKGKTKRIIFLRFDVAAACVHSIICTLIVSRRSIAWYPPGKLAISIISVTNASIKPVVATTCISASRPSHPLAEAFISTACSSTALHSRKLGAFDLPIAFEDRVSMQSQSQPQPQSQQVSPHEHAGSSPSFKQESSQDASRFLLAAQQRFHTGSQSPLSASASTDQPGSGYQSSSAQSASGEPTHEDNLASSSAPGSRRPSSLSRKASEGHRNQKHKWSAEETQALVDGCNKHGVGNWKKILSDPELSPLFSDRTAGDLKDRFRTYFPDAYHEMYPNAKTHLSKAVRGRDAEGKSIFEKGKTKERRPFTPEEDAALRAGYQQYGSHWALIAKNPIFNGQRRAIDLRDRFRNAFPEDYERAGFKPRPSKARKERGPSAAKPGQGHAARSAAISGTVSDNSLSEGAWRGSDHPLSDTTSDGHLTDHGNLTDYSYFTDQGNLTDGGAEPILSGTSSGTNSALGRSNSLTHSMPRFMSTQAAQSEQLSFGQALAMQQQQLQSSTQARPPFLSSNTAPLPGAGLPLRATDMVTGQSIHSLFEQLQQASLEGPGTSSETSSTRELATPPSAGDSDMAHQHQFQQPSVSSHAKAVSADDARRQAGKHAIHDGIQHKRRSHASRAGKNSALERLPSVHGHLHHMHGHPHGSAHSNPHSRPHSQSSSQHDSPAGGAVPIQSDARLSPLGHTEYPVQPDVLAWLNPAGQSMLPPSAASMEIDQHRAVGEVPSSWSAYSSSAGDASGAGPAGSSSRSFFGNQQPMYGTGFNFDSQNGYISPTHPGQVGGAAMVPGMGSASDSSASSAAGSRRSSAAENAFAQPQQFQQASAKSSGEQQADMAGNFSTGSIRSFADTFSGGPGDAAQWNVDWDLGSISDSGLRPDQVDELLASFPLSHHPWAGDLNHGAPATGAGESDGRNPAFMGINVAQMSSASSRGQSEISSNTSGATGPIDQAQDSSEAMLRQMQALGNFSQLQQGAQRQHQHQQPLDSNQTGASTNTDGGVSFASVTFGDPLIRDDREGSPDSLELQREQTFTARDVGKRLGLDDLELNKDVEESDDDQRRRSTDTLRRAEGALDLALESVEDTRALAFAQQFQRDLDSDEDSDEEADEDGYEEDEEDDNEPDYDLEGTAQDYNFQQVLDDLSNSEGMSSNFFDGPFDAEGMGATPGAPGAPGQLDFDGSDLSLYPDLGRSVANRQQQQDLVAQASDSAPTDRSQEQQGGAAAAAAAAGLMNQMWNGGMAFDQQQQQQPSMGSTMHPVVPTNTNAFANVQPAGWTSSPVDNGSTNYGINHGAEPEQRQRKG